MMLSIAFVHLFRWKDARIMKMLGRLWRTKWNFRRRVVGWLVVRFWKGW